MRLLAITLTTALLAACSYFERAPVYPQAKEVGRIETPNGLIRPSSDPAYDVPAGRNEPLSKEQRRPPNWETTDADGDAK